ncbi:HAD family hydrolase [Clostridium neonatale]|uniref:HAD family hydrolase n=1 Tax=Clostridium neonatale TaxID=137838 RepID=UPI00291B8CF2|nr:conserved hypothetical protein [Clostridium neonatale]CAI3669674.1 conserved hypothetical protein [Clostridium neonatale]CAI3670409.1 conserved hypothetical protein [Clostridium neonatale]CAI3686616.1 conserved hypothetical protein [Clostridium neonatale]CAI3716524.1 conserved hypothetical protein [Clostridium neonatale]
MDYFLELESIKKQIDNFQVVSFDIFDTLLLRNVYKPIDIFKIVEIEYFDKFNKKIDFSELRIKAEENARNKSDFEDITLEDIYECIQCEIGSEAEKLKNIEIECEKKFIIANEGMKSVYNYAKEQGKKILFITDMYLSSDVIKVLLKTNGYEVFDGLYVSSETKKTKATGTIYNYIRKKMNLRDSVSWLHIGDNYLSDVVRANENNVVGIYYKRILDRVQENNIHNLSDSIVFAIKINELYNNESYGYWERFGVEKVSPIYIGLMFNLIKELRGKDNIYFLSRDGYLPYEMYKIIKQYYSDLPEGKYIYASRRAYIYPTLLKNKNEAIDFFLKNNIAFGEKLNIKGIFKNLNLDTSLYRNVLDKYGIEDGQIIITNKNIGIIKQILNDLWEQIRIQLLEEKEMLSKYLEQEDILNYDKVNIFDIGWSGSTHKALIELTDKDIYGYYFGTVETMDNMVSKKAFGYAFDNGMPVKRRKKILDNVMIYELIFTAPHGSLKRFIYNKEGAIIPELMEFQSSYMYKCVKNFQKGSIKVLRKSLEYRKYFLQPLSKQFVFNSMEQFINDKKIIDMVQFEKINNIVSIGESDNIKTYVTRVKSGEYLKNIKYYNKISETSFWKDALIIEDEQGRLFNLREFRKLYRLKSNGKLIKTLKKIMRLLKKVILNPKKCFYKIRYILTIRIKR